MSSKRSNPHISSLDCSVNHNTKVLEKSFDPAVNIMFLESTITHTETCMM